MTVPWILLSLAGLCVAYSLLFVYPTTSRKVWFTERQLAEWTDRTLAQRALHDQLVWFACLGLTDPTNLLSSFVGYLVVTKWKQVECPEDP